MSYRIKSQKDLLEKTRKANLMGSQLMGGKQWSTATERHIIGELLVGLADFAQRAIDAGKTRLPEESP